MLQDVEAGRFEPVAQPEEAADDRKQGQKGSRRHITHSPTHTHIAGTKLDRLQLKTTQGRNYGGVWVLKHSHP